MAAYICELIRAVSLRWLHRGRRASGAGNVLKAANRKAYIKV